MLHVRPTAPADLEALSALYAEGFGRPLSPAEWEWKYRRSPGEGRSLVGVDGAGALLAHAGALALPASWEGGEGLLWQLTDFVGRRRGLRPPLLPVGRQLLRDLPRAGDLPWIFGFPSARHLALGERVFDYRWLPAIEPWAGELAAATGGPAGERAALREVGDQPGAWAEAAWLACGGRGVRRSVGFLAWRYHARPERYYRFYRLERGGAPGLVVAAFLGPEAWLAEVWLPAGPDWLPALRAVGDDLRAAGIARWRAWPPADGPDLLRRLGMAPTGESIPCGCRGATGSGGRSRQEVEAASGEGPARGRADGADDPIVALARSLYYAMGDHDYV